MYVCLNIRWLGEHQVLDQLNQMHGPLSGRLEAAESRAQRDISLDGHLDFVCGLRGAYGARCAFIDDGDSWPLVDIDVAAALVLVLEDK